jgi:hypothetical protein
VPCEAHPLADGKLVLGHCPLPSQALRATFRKPPVPRTRRANLCARAGLDEGMFLRRLPLSTIAPGCQACGLGSPSRCWSIPDDGGARSFRHAPTAQPYRWARRSQEEVTRELDSDSGTPRAPPLPPTPPSGVFTETTDSATPGEVLSVSRPHGRPRTAQRWLATGSALRPTAPRRYRPLGRRRRVGTLLNAPRRGHCGGSASPLRLKPPFPLSPFPLRCP